MGARRAFHFSALTCIHEVCSNLLPPRPPDFSYDSAGKLVSLLQRLGWAIAAPDVQLVHTSLWKGKNCAASPAESILECRASAS